MQFNTFKERNLHTRMAVPTAEQTRGFTLIEIMVTISIIVILISVSYVGFNAARDRADDDAIKQQLGLMRIEAERIYRVNRQYTAVCSGIAATTIDDELPTGTQWTCIDTGAYAFSAQLSNNQFYCVDWFGRVETTQSQSISGSTCSGGDCDCR